MKIGSERYDTGGHRHYITECLYRGSQKKTQSSGSGLKDTYTSTTVQSNQNNTSGKETVIYKEKYTAGKEKIKRGFDFIRSFWGSLGDQGAIRHDFPYRIINKWQFVREKIKAGIGAALKRFKRGEESFSALSNPGNHFGRNRNETPSMETHEGEEIRGKKQNLSFPAVPSETYLLDSYSKEGEYCHIKDNL